MTPAQAIDRLTDCEWELNAAYKQEDHFKKKFYPHKKDKFYNIEHDGPALERIRDRVRDAKIARFKAFKAAVELFLTLPLEQRQQAAKSTNKVIRKVGKESLDSHPLHKPITVYIPTGVYLALRDKGVNIETEFQGHVSDFITKGL